MQWDLGLRGLGLLTAMSLGFGILAQLLVGKSTTRLMWIVAAVIYFASGLFISEVWFGWAIEEDLQPNIDGLSFDEVLLAVVPGIAAVLVTRYVIRRRRPSTATWSASGHAPRPDSSGSAPLGPRGGTRTAPCRVRL